MACVHNTSLFRVQPFQILFFIDRLGLTHDGEGQCEKDSLRGSVMAPTVLATLQNYAWSSCSKEQFHEKSKYDINILIIVRLIAENGKKL